MIFEKKLLASDIDGTLYINRKISQEDIDAIEKWQKAGHIFGICSGRSVKDAIRALSESGIRPNFFLCSSGAVATDCKGNILYKNPMPQEAPRALWEIAKTYDYDAFTGHCINGTTLHGRNDQRPEYINCKVEDLFDQELTQCYIAFHTIPGQAAKFGDEVERRLPYINVHRNDHYIDCTAKGTNKAVGVAYIADHFHIDHHQCFTIGDNQNDLPMLLSFNGYCMERGDAYTIEKTGRTAPSVAALIHSLIK